MADVTGQHGTGMSPGPPAGGPPPLPAESPSDSTPGGIGLQPDPREEVRRRRIRRVANTMIILASLGLVGIVLYFVVTWLMASASQDALRDELAADNPGLSEAAENVSEEDFVTIGSLIENAAEEERLRQLAALKAVADDYYKKTIRNVGKAVGDLLIPMIGVETIVIQGNFERRGESYLRNGPGHWPETPMPGQGGSVVISGHRSTYGAPFRKINELQPGDVIELTMPYAIIRYEVTQVIIVAPDEVGVVADRGKEMISLVACHPVYSAKERIIAQADMSSFVLLGVDQ